MKTKFLLTLILAGVPLHAYSAEVVNKTTCEAHGYYWCTTLNCCISNSLQCSRTSGANCISSFDGNGEDGGEEEVDSIISCDGGQYYSNGECHTCPAPGTSDGDYYDPNAVIDTSGIQNCYIPAGTTFSDDIGGGTYTDKCPYL